MKNLALLLVLPSVLLAIDGTVVNQTTGKPQPNVILSLIQPGQGGMQTLGSTKSGADGKFAFTQSPGDGPALIQALYAGVTYTKMLQPGAAPNVEVPVFDSSSKPDGTKLDQHIILVQPGDSNLQVNELFMVRNTGKLTYNDPARGTLRFSLPEGHGEVSVRVSGPGGMPVGRPATSAGGGLFKVDFPVKPGETRFDLSYEVNTKNLTGRKLDDAETRIIVPQGVTLEGDGAVKIGVVPENQANVYQVQSAAYKMSVNGTGSLRLGESSGGGEGGGNPGAEEDNGQPKIEQTMPRIYQRLPLVMGLAIAILGLGFAVLFRSGKA